VLTQWTRNLLYSISSMISGPHRWFNRCLVLLLTLGLLIQQQREDRLAAEKTHRAAEEAHGASEARFAQLQ
jgi:hypothetical protein